MIFFGFLQLINILKSRQLSPPPRSKPMKLKLAGDGNMLIETLTLHHFLWSNTVKKMNFTDISICRKNDTFGRDDILKSARFGFWKENWSLLFNQSSSSMWTEDMTLPGSCYRNYCKIIWKRDQNCVLDCLKQDTNWGRSPFEHFHLFNNSWVWRGPWPLPWLHIDEHMARGERMLLQIIKDRKEKLDVKQNSFVSCCYIQGFNSRFCFNLNPNNA